LAALLAVTQSPSGLGGSSPSLHTLVLVSFQQKKDSAMDSNKEIQEVIVSYMGKVESVVQNMSDFASDQIPLVIQEYLAWQFYSGMVILVLLLSLSSVACAIGMKFLKIRSKVEKKNEYTSDYSVNQTKEGYMICSVISFILSAIFFFNSFIPAYGMVKVKVAPRVVLIDWLKDSVQK